MTDGEPHTPDPAQHLMQIGGGYIFSSALHAVAAAGVADELASGPRTCAELAAATRTNEDALYRLLRLLASAGIFTEIEPRTFGLTPPAELLQKAHPRSMHDMLVFMADPLHFRVFADLGESLRTGRPAAEKTFGMPPFEYFRSHPEYSEVFNRAMTNNSARSVPAALEVCDFTGARVVVDIAGGHGALLTAILRAHPSLRGVLMDLDHVIAGAKPHIAAAGLSDRLETVAGDFFAAVPPGGDVYLLKHIIHDWDDERAARILRNVRSAIGGSAGRLLVLEGVVAAGNGADAVKVLDIEMLALPGGRERSVDEFVALLAAGGFDLTSITPTRSPLCVIEARPA